MDSVILQSMLKVNPEIGRSEAENISSALATQLRARGLLTENDLKLVTIEHLQAENLNEFQALRLKDWWNTGRHLKQTDQQTNQSRSNILAVPIPWDYIWQQDKFSKKDKGELAQALIVDKRRPSSSAELLLINAMVHAAKTAHPSAKRCIMEPMADEVAKLYPKSFVDEVGNTVLNHMRFMKHCKDQFDNYEPRPCNTRSKVQKENRIVNLSAKAVLGLSIDSWHDIELPPGETEESQEELREELLLFAKKRKETDIERITFNLQKTYPTQRKAILQMHKDIKTYQNKKKRKQVEDPMPEITDLTNDWPHLFKPIGLELHFNRLYNLNMQECFDLFFTYNDSKIIDYLVASQGIEGNKIRMCMDKAIEKGHDAVYVKMLGLMTLLSRAFKEQINVFILNEDPTTQVEDVAQLPGLQSTPCIVACGPNTFTARKFYLSMDKFCFFASPTFKDVFKAAFSMFYVYHIDFPRKFGLVCEFIQREILNINTDFGSKRAEANSSCPIPEKIASLLRDCEKYHKELGEASSALDSNSD